MLLAFKSLLILCVGLLSCANCAITSNQIVSSSYSENLPRSSSVLISDQVLVTYCEKTKGKLDCSFKILKFYGSGSILANHKTSSTILTADHVCTIKVPEELEGKLKIIATVIKVTDLDMNEYNTQVKKTDEENDMCLLETTKPINKPALKISEKEPQPGDKILNIGSPNGFFKKNLVILQEGYYNGWHLYQDKIPIAIYSLMTFPGASGSMLLNSQGQLIGMIHSGYSAAPIITRSPTLSVLKKFVNSYLTSKNK